MIKHAIYISVLAVFIMVSDAFADHFRVPSVTDGEMRKFKVTRKYSQKKKGGFAGFIRPEEITVSFSTKCIWSMKNGGRFLEVERREKKAGGYYRKWNFTFRAAENFHFERYEMIEHLPDGKIFGREGGRPWVPGEKVPPGVVHPMALAEAIRGFKFKEGKKWKFLTWIPQTEEMTQLIARVDRMDRIDLPAGSYRAWRVWIDVDLEKLLGKWRGLEFFVKPLVPKLIMWFADTPQSPMIKFRGKFGPGRSAIIELHELVEMTR